MPTALYTKILREQRTDESLMETFNRLAPSMNLPQVPIGVVYYSDSELKETQFFLDILKTKFESSEKLFKGMLIVKVYEPLEHEPLLFKSKTNLKTFLECMEHTIVSGKLENSS